MNTDGGGAGKGLKSFWLNWKEAVGTTNDTKSTKEEGLGDL